MMHRIMQFTLTGLDPDVVLGHAADVFADMAPIAMTVMGIALGLRIYRSVKRG